MIEVEFRLLGTEVLNIRLGRPAEERDDCDELQPYAWLGGRPLTMKETFEIIRDADGADETETVGWDDLDEEWADLEE